MVPSIDVLFTAGLGFDASGALLLGLGLLTSAKQIAWRGTTYWGVSPIACARMADDRINASSGIAALVVGLSCQLGGYLLIVDGRHAGTGFRQALLAGTAGVAAIGLTLLVWWGTRGLRRRRLLVKVARHVPGGRKESAGSPDATNSEDWLPHLPILCSMGAEFFPRHADESDELYACRVFRVTESFTPTS